MGWWKEGNSKLADPDPSTDFLSRRLYVFGYYLYNVPVKRYLIVVGLVGLEPATNRL